LLLEGILIVELKTAKALAPEHEAQVFGYLKSAKLERAANQLRVAEIRNPEVRVDGRERRD
jgi:hypothetical protein